MNSLLLKAFRVFHILNKDIRTPLNSSSIARKRHLGTLIANLNFLIEHNRENGQLPSIAYTTLQSDLIKLGKLVAPSQSVSLPQILQLLGFTQKLGSKTDLIISHESENYLPNDVKELCDLDHLHHKWQDYVNSFTKESAGMFLI